METTKPQSNKNKIIGTIAFGIAFTASSLAVQHFMKPDFNQTLIKLSHKVNKMCPMMIDAETRVDSVTLPADKTIQYNYTIIRMEQSYLDPDTVKKILSPIILNNIKTDPEMKFFMDNKVTFQYNYNDKNGLFVFKHVVTPDMYR